MSGALIIGVDVGTQGTKAVLCDATGACVAEAFRPSHIIEPMPGVFTEDPEEQYASVCQTIKECLERSGAKALDIAAIAVAGQMAGILGVGRDGLHTIPYDSWLDTRCAPYIERMNDGGAVLESTGTVASINHGPKILWWMNERPDEYRNIAAFVTPGSYAAMRLCGLPGDMAFMDVTYLHFSGFADNANLRWNEEIGTAFGLDLHKLPRIVRPTEIIGHVTREAGRATGLLEGTPVAAGCGDTAASFLACGAVVPGICVDVAGTASVFSITSERFLPDTASRVLGCGQAVAPGLWHHYAYINGGGMNLEWFRKMLGSSAAGAPGTGGFDGLNSLAHVLNPREDDPYFIPHLGGRAMPSAAHLRGAWLNLSWSHGIGHLFRSMLEAVALEYCIYLNAMKRLDVSIHMHEIRITGGGEKSEIWNQIKADATQIPVVRLADTHGTPRGSAMVAACAAGIAPSVGELATAWVRTGPSVCPDPSLRQHYAARSACYERFLEAVIEVSRIDGDRGEHK